MKKTLHNNQIALWDIYLDDGTHLTALADFEERISELKEYIDSISLDIRSSLQDHNYELSDQMIQNAQSLASDAQGCFDFDWEAIQADVNAFHKNRVFELIKL